MNNNTFSSTTTINDDYMLFPYNDHYSSLPLSPSSSSINDLLIHSNTPNNHHPFLQAPSPFSPFDFVQDFSLPSFHTQNNGHDNNQTTPNDHPPPPPSPLPPLSNPIEESQLVEPWETITQIEDSQRISSSAPQDPKTKKVKKPTRADRHSKIKTAKGTRDRRMRLSLDVARELFGLQDMLGFEKASKTVEWLLIQAKPEIMKIAKTLPHQCGLSSGEESHTRPALGSTDTSPDLSELASMWTVDDSGSNINMTEMKVDGRSMRGKRKRPEPRTPILKKMSKDERAKARERAKKRTNEKMMKRRSQVNVVEEEEAHKSNNSDVNSTPYKEENEQLCKKDRLRVGEDFLMNNKYPLLNGHRNQGATTSMEQHHHQFTDLHHFFGKPRDLMYNYYNMR